LPAGTEHCEETDRLPMIRRRDVHDAEPRAGQKDKSLGKRTRETMKVAGFALWLAVAVAALLAAVALFQHRLLYFPARAQIEDMVSARLRAWPSEQDFRGLVAEPMGAVRATAIVFHGNAGHARHREFYAAALVPLGLRVILAEYPGYGPRGGSVGEHSLVGDAVQTIALAHRLHGAPVLVVGESLGAGVAAAAAARQRDKVAGLLLITPWDRLERVAAHHYPWLPVRWLLRDRYDSAVRLASFGRPIVVAVAERDGIVPARFGVALCEALSDPKRLVVFKGAGHNDWTEHLEDGWWREATAFLLGEEALP
jgi:pimeloyl-ACP methyl ester carboxylesterase